MSVKGYAPELLTIFKIASQRTFTFDCGSKQAAENLRWRLHSLRRDMRRERHYLLPTAERVKFRINDSLLIGQPPDTDILPELRKAIVDQAGDIDLTEPDQTLPILTQPDYDLERAFDTQLGRGIKK